MNKIVYTVYSDEVFHYQDSDYRTERGVFATYQEAVDFCQQEIRSYVTHFLTRQELALDWMHWGEDLWISPEPEGSHFSTREYMEYYNKQRKDFI